MQVRQWSGTQGQLQYTLYWYNIQGSIYDFDPVGPVCINLLKGVWGNVG